VVPEIRPLAGPQRGDAEHDGAIKSEPAVEIGQAGHCRIGPSPSNRCGAVQAGVVIGAWADSAQGQEGHDNRVEKRRFASDGWPVAELPKNGCPGEEASQGGRDEEKERGGGRHRQQEMPRFEESDRCGQAGPEGIDEPRFALEDSQQELADGDEDEGDRQPDGEDEQECQSDHAVSGRNMPESISLGNCTEGGSGGKGGRQSGQRIKIMSRIRMRKTVRRCPRPRIRSKIGIKSRIAWTGAWSRMGWRGAY